MSRTETYHYLVTNDLHDGHDKISAAYYVHEDEFTVFKDQSGGIVASFANKHIVGIEREAGQIVNVRLDPDSILDGAVSAAAIKAAREGLRRRGKALPNGI